MKHSSVRGLQQHSKILHPKILAVGLHPYRSIIHEFKAGAKISQTDVTIHIQENVVWLDVSARERTTFNTQLHRQVVN